MTAPELLSRLDGVKSRGTGKWVARCISHQDKTPSLSIAEGARGLLVKCWAGCTLDEIAAALGIKIKDLFYDGLPNPRQRLEALQRRAQAQMAQRATDKARGLKTDLLRQAEYLIQSARGLSIDAWTPNQLDKRLNCLADAYDVLLGERHEQY